MVEILKDYTIQHIKDLERGIAIAERLAKALSDLEADGLILDDEGIIEAWYDWNGTERPAALSSAILLTRHAPSAVVVLAQKTKLTVNSHLCEELVINMQPGQWLVQHKLVDSVWCFDIVQIS